MDAIEVVDVTSGQAVTAASTISGGAVVIFLRHFA
jgi:hypothetical protein